MSKSRFLLFALTIVPISLALACNTLSSTPVDTATPAVPTQYVPPAIFTEQVTSVRLTLVTGSDGTVDNPILQLVDRSFTPLLTFTLDNPVDLQPNQTDVYEFSAPHPMCQIVAYQLTKPTDSGVDDSWLPTEIYIELNGVRVFHDLLFSDLGTVTADSVRDGNWSGIEVFIQHCGE